MANTLSASKRSRQAQRRNALNRMAKTRYRNLRKRIDAALENGQKEEAAKHIRSYASALDKAVKINVIHKNSAARHKSAVNKLMAGSAPAAAATV